ncbi:SH3 domain-containing protein [Actinomadura alba]|uniref:SH3b domain-containing protein n=1 Tax=Actinomadura alba TaxID=406431 RepID=A0ABR7M1W5_9ACTN|nr:hypothetical protein [Actinomadura alba]MBC6471113.1 hypothetical protein [Actinomadura alba]
MTPITRAAAVLAASTVAGGLLAAGSPSQAATRPTLPAWSCSYQVAQVPTGTALDVLSGPGIGNRAVGSLGSTGRRIPGACRSTHGWRQVKAPNGRTGWVLAKNLRPVRSSHHRALRCAYQVTRVRPGSHLRVRTGPGTGYRIIGRLHKSDGRAAGACRSAHGWRQVKAPNGRTGWSSTRYLRGIPGNGPAR